MEQQNKSPQGKFLTIKDVCGLLRLNRSTIYRQIKEGVFPRPIKIGKAARWRASDFKEFLESDSILADSVDVTQVKGTFTLKRYGDKYALFLTLLPLSNEWLTKEYKEKQMQAGVFLSNLFRNQQIVGGRVIENLRFCTNPKGSVIVEVGNFSTHKHDETLISAVNTLLEAGVLEGHLETE